MKYQVKEGYTFGGAVLLPAGSFVELTEAEAAAFLDKLQPVEGGEPEAQEALAASVSVTVSVPGEPAGSSKRKG